MPDARVESHPVVQERSRQTRDRLLDATEYLLARDGADGATVPAIARRAGVAVGSVYRRFPDKDALLRGVYERFFAEGLETNREGLAPEQWRGLSAYEMVHRLVAGMVAGYRQKRPILRALLLYGENHADAAFREHAAQLRAETTRMIGDLLVARASELGHPRPRKAVEMSLSIVRLTLQGFVLQDDLADRLDDRLLVEELTRVVTSYLGIAKRS